MADSDNIQKKIEDSLEDISAIIPNTELMAAQSARVQLELRTFSTGGTGVKDIKGQPLSKYSGAYAKKRELAGLQSDHKDLIFSKNTSVIKDNTTVGLSGGKPALGFTKPEAAKVAGYQEEQNNTKIFQLNDNERENVKKDVKEFVMDSLKKIIDGWK